MIPSLRRFPPVSLVLDVWDAYCRFGIARAAAALSYFLILTLFPLLVCVNYFIALLPLELEDVISALDQFIPDQALAMVLDYLSYIADNQSPALLLASLFTILISASAGLRTLLHTLDELYGRRSVNPFLRIGLSLLLSVLFLVTIYLSVVVIFTGGWFFQFLETHLPHPLQELIPVSALGALWRWMRYLLLFCLMLVMVLILYRLGISRVRASTRQIRLAALITAVGMVACSAVFSWLIDMSTRYSLVYGSLTSLIVLLVWLYFCGNIFLLGAVTARVLSVRRDSPSQPG